MLRGLYTSAMGISLLYKKQEVSSNNLANVNTVGYKKETVIAESFPQMLLYRLNDPSAPHSPAIGRIGTGVRMAEVSTDYSSGIHKNTDKPLEFALKSEGYFVINTPQGERYTRNGSFQLDTEGRLVTSDGYPVMGLSGEITLPHSAISIDERGTISADGKRVDALRIVDFNEPPLKEGASLFQGEDPADVLNPQILQGMVEESNAAALEEMVNMISLMRAYESNQKLIQTQDSTLEKAVNEVARV